MAAPAAPDAAPTIPLAKDSKNTLSIDPNALVTLPLTDDNIPLKNP